MGVMRGTQHGRLVVCLLALAASSLPAVAQSGSEDVDCAGSETANLRWGTHQ